MSLSADDVRRIAHLARLAVSDDEIAAVQSQLNGILGMVETLRAVDTQGVAPMAHAVEMTQRLRADAVTEPDRRAAYQEAAPAVENGLFLVPRVIE